MQVVSKLRQRQHAPAESVVQDSLRDGTKSGQVHFQYYGYVLPNGGRFSERKEFRIRVHFVFPVAEPMSRFQGSCLACKPVTEADLFTPYALIASAWHPLPSFLPWHANSTQTICGTASGSRLRRYCGC